MKEPQENLRLFVARFEKTPATIDIQQERVDAFFNGFILIECVLTEKECSVLAVRNISVWGNDLPSLGGYLDFAGPLPRLDLTESNPLDTMDVNMFYPLLGKKDPVLEEFDAVYPPLEILRGKMSLEILDKSEMSPRSSLSLFLEADPKNLLGIVRAVTLEEVELNFQPLTGSGEEITHHSLNACTGAPPAGGQANYSLTLRFVSLSTVPGNQPAAGALVHPLEGVAQAQINGACEVWWLRAGIKLTPYQVAGQLDIIEAINKLGGVPSPAVQQNLPNQNNAGQAVNAAIEVYLVDQLLGTALNPATGGGITFGNGTRDAFVILEINKAQNNPYLLAHELGHVLRLIHPGEPLPASNPNNLIHGSECSVMVPDSPMSSRNTINNINQARTPPPLGPLLDIGVGTCTLNPSPNQTFYHIVRDFPLDDGVEPSVPKPPATFWWTHSDVWNSNKLPGTINMYLPTTPGGLETPMFNPDHSPIHTEPSRLHTNQMYVRLHTCNQLTSDVDVHLFLAVPGVALEPLTRITPLGAGEVNPLLFDVNGSGPFINTRPSPGSPTYKKIEWNVPAGYPAHCCVFAAAVSANEADGGLGAIVNNPATNHFIQLFNRLANDNDVAQRNLHIQNILPWKDSLHTILNWLQFANPMARAGQATLIIDARRAARLTNLQFMWENGESLSIEGWQKEAHSLRLASSIQPGSRFAFRLHAVLPPDLPMGSEFPIQLSFRIGRKLVGGFTHLIRVSPFEHVAGQVLDNLYGAFLDCAEVLRSNTLHELANEVRYWALRYPDSPERALLWISYLASHLLDCTENLDTDAHFIALQRAHGYHAGQIQDLLFLLVAALSSRRIPQSPWLERVRYLSDRLQWVAGRLIRESQ
jgi:hypothetical protein